MKEIFFFSVGIFSARYFLGRIFFALKSLCRTFFSEVTLTVIPPLPPPQKSNGPSLIKASSSVPSPRWGGLSDEPKEHLHARGRLAIA